MRFAAADYVNKVGSGFDGSGNDGDDTDQKKKERYPLIYTTKSAAWLDCCCNVVVKG